MEDPETLAGANVESPDESLHVGLAARDAARPMRRADDHGVLRDERCRMKPDFAGDEINLLIVIELQIDRAVRSEAGDRRSILRVERQEAIARGHVENSLFAAVGPVRQATARELPWRVGAPVAFSLAVHPEQLARRRIERDDRSPRSCRGVDDAVRHQRRALQLKFGPRSQVLGLEPPGDLEVVEVARVDLIERRVPGVAEVSAVGPPFALRRSALTDNRCGEPREEAGQGGESRKP